MVIEQLLISGHSKGISLEIVSYIDGKTEPFRKLMECFTGSNFRISQRASWVVSLCADRWPFLLEPYSEDFILLLKQQNSHNSIRRNIMRIYQTVTIPERVEGELYSLAIGFIQNNNEAIAVRAFSITVAYRIVEKYPDLGLELISSLEIIIPNASSGLKNRANKVLKKLERL